LSRCQRFNLRRIESGRLAEHFSDIVVKEKADAEPEALKLIALAADGSVRDGLSLLDQAIARGNGKVAEADVKDMLGLADRAHSLSLCRQLLRGDIHEALRTYATLRQVGADPLQVLQDLTELAHSLTRAQIIADYADSPDMPEAERSLFTDLVDIKIPALTRVWQILLKGIGEIQVAPNPDQAAEMVLIRLAYAAELPLPADLVRHLRETAPLASVASAPKFPSPGGSAPRGSAALARVPETVPMAVAQATSLPATFGDVVALFAANREGGLHAQLWNFVHMVRYEPGLLEIRLEPNAAPDLVNRLSYFLTQWTGRRWLISVVDGLGAPTLAEEQKQAGEARQARLRAHPLMKAVLNSFPQAKIVALRQKDVVIATAPAEIETGLPNEEEESEWI
jgi:DNA polymerase-3 subunit gamma/tau